MNPRPGVGRRALAVIAVSALFLAAPSCDDEEREGRGADPAVKASGNETETTAKSAPSEEPGFVGKWLMTKEEPADGRGGFFEQKRRLLELERDGSFTVENFYSKVEGTWRMSTGGIILTSKSGEEEKAHRIELVKVTAEELVLVEDLPEIYERDGGPRRVRNTYRRVSTRELGPMLGGKIARFTPQSGRYAAEYDYRVSKYPTMEIHISKGIDGAGELTLNEDGTMAACFGRRLGEHSSFSKYVPGETGNRVENDEYRNLLGIGGHWKKVGNQVVLTAAVILSGTCDVTSADADASSPVELSCAGIKKNEKLPVDTLACRIEQGPSWLEDIAVNPADTERAGPYSFQSDPMGHIATDPGRPWILLGAAPGLHVKSTDDREHPAPKLTFTAKKAEMTESAYRRRPES